MNCANHPDIAPVAYCRTCGKPLCANCTRDVKGVIYCENCLAERLHGVQPASLPPAAGFVPSAPAPITPGSGPNPAVAGILAGFFPFGVGAVYCGQYAKGLAHLVIFTMLIWGETVIQNDGINTILGLGIAFFYVWQIIDSIRTAKAIQMGQTPPDPFGLAQAFGGGEPAPPGQPVQPAPGCDATQPSKIPTAAVVLIGLGVLFLLQTAGVFEFGWDRVWPFFLIGLGIWMFAVREGWVASRRRSYYRIGRRRTLVGPVVLVTVGILSLLESYNGPHWNRTWPVLLLAIGITKLLEGRTPPPPMPPGPGPTGGVTSDVSAPASPAPTSEVRNG
jgi:cell wall-active antibiotic response 4TMS protein YvqF/B-box zinc finger protein